MPKKKFIVAKPQISCKELVNKKNKNLTRNEKQEIARNLLVNNQRSPLAQMIK